jgi:hypothetical protein
MGIKQKIMNAVMAWHMRRMLKRALQDMQAADAAYGDQGE